MHLTFQPAATLEQVIQAASQIENHERLYPETLAGFYPQVSNVSQISQYQLNRGPLPPIPQIQNAITGDNIMAVLQALGNLNLN